MRRIGLLGAFARGFGQLSDLAARRVLWLSLGLSLATYLLVGVGAWYAVGLLPQFESHWLNVLVKFLSGVGVLLALAVLFPALIGVFLGFFLDDVALAAERRHYPGDPPGRALAILPAIWLSGRFLLLMVGANLLALPFYVVLFWFPPLNLIVFYGLNGYLLGREYFEMVARRHLDAAATRALRRRFSGRVLLAGIGVAVLFSLPLVGLLMPLVATALMVHLFKDAERVSWPVVS